MKRILRTDRVDRPRQTGREPGPPDGRGPSRPPGPRTGFAADEAAVSPVIGYILTFAITSGLLVVIVTSTAGMLDERHHAAARVQFIDLAHRVANAAEEAIYIVDANPDADYRKRLPLPEDIRGFHYVIKVDDGNVWINATRPTEIEAHTVLHNPTGHTVQGEITRHIAAILEYDPATQDITLTGGT